MNTLRILEISWLIFGLVSIGLCIYNLATNQLMDAIWPLIFTFFAAIFYMFRRKQRIAYERSKKGCRSTMIQIKSLKAEIHLYILDFASYIRSLSGDIA